MIENKFRNTEEFAELPRDQQYLVVRKKFEVEFERKKKVIMILGDSRIGKSTLAYLLSGCIAKICHISQSQVYHFEEENSQKPTIYNEKIIKYGPNSFTEFPNFLPFEGDDTIQIVDNAGIKDVSFLQRFINSYYQKNTVRNSQEIHFIIVTKIHNNELSQLQSVMFSEIKRTFPNSSEYITICVNNVDVEKMQNQNIQSELKEIMKKKLSEDRGVEGVMKYYMKSFSKDFILVPSAESLKKKLRKNSYQLPEKVFTGLKDIKFQPTNQCKYIHVDITDGIGEYTQKFSKSMNFVQLFINLLKNKMEKDQNILFELLMGIVDFISTKDLCILENMSKIIENELKKQRELLAPIEDPKITKFLNFPLNSPRSFSLSPKKYSDHSPGKSPSRQSSRKNQVNEKINLQRIIETLHKIYEKQRSIFQKKFNHDFERLKSYREFSMIYLEQLKKILPNILETHSSEKDILQFLSLKENTRSCDISIIEQAFEVLQAQETDSKDLRKLQEQTKCSEILKTFLENPLKEEFSLKFLKKVQLDKAEAEIYQNFFNNFLDVDPEGNEDGKDILDDLTEEELRERNKICEKMRELSAYIFHQNKNASKIEKIENIKNKLSQTIQFIGEFHQSLKEINDENKREFEIMRRDFQSQRIKKILIRKLANYYIDIKNYGQSLTLLFQIKDYAQIENIIEQNFEIKPQNYSFFIKYGDQFKHLKIYNHIALKMYDKAHGCNISFNEKRIKEIQKRKEELFPKYRQVMFSDSTENSQSQIVMQIERQE